MCSSRRETLGDYSRQLTFQILVVGRDNEIVQALQNHFTGAGRERFEVLAATGLEGALALCHERLPDWIVLDATSANIERPDDCREILFPCTEYTFILPAEKRGSLMLSPYEVLFKPFQLQELVRQIETTLDKRYEQNLKNPITFSPAEALVKERIRGLIADSRVQDWKLILVHIDNFDAFINMYGLAAGDEALCFVTLMLKDVVHMLGVSDWLASFRESGIFIGQTDSDFYLVVTSSQDVTHIVEYLDNRFREFVGKYCDGGLAPSIALCYGIVSSQDKQLSSVDEILDAASARLSA
jgi:GGDEF domain-containing protein